MDNTLFGGQVMDRFLASNRQQLKSKVDKVNSLADLAKLKPADLLKTFAVKPVKLQRAKAEFATEEETAGAKVTLSIPYKGDAVVLGFRQTEREYSLPAVSGVYETSVRRWDVGQAVDTTPRVKISKTFKDAGPAAVRVWAKAQVDTIEATLTGFESAIATYNDELVPLIETLLVERETVLMSAKNLREGLGGGI